MNKEEFSYINAYFHLNLSDDVFFKLCEFKKIFLEFNSHTNLMSKGDLKLLWEKHIFDSFAFFLLPEAAKKKLNVLDIGAGGGFPSLILALSCPDIHFVAVDSVSKKINFINSCISQLELKNMSAISKRVENISPLNADLILSRAVGTISYVYDISKRHLNKNGKFVFYKANPEIFKKEIEEFNESHKRINPKIFSYKLPTKDEHKRNLVVF